VLILGVMRVMRLVTAGSEQVVCGRCAIADRPWTRLRGLLGRRELPSGEGMLIRPARSIHTVGMRFPIDVVYLDRDLTVLKLTRRLRPWRASGCLRAHSALELSAGECERVGVRIGERLRWGAFLEAA
jgi:uncharacterized protein